VLLALAVYGVIVALLVHNSLAAARLHRKTSDAFELARYNVAAEESLERKYRLEPGPTVRASYYAAADAFSTALHQAASTGDARDRAQVDSALAAHQAFVEDIGRLFAAVDAGDSRQVLAIDALEDPDFDALESQIDRLASDDRQEANLAISGAAAVQNGVIIATPLTLVIGLILLAIFWNMLRHRTVEALRAEQHALATSERRLRALLKNATDMILLVDAAGQIQADKASPEQFLGFAQQAIVGHPLVDLLLPDDRGRVGTVLRDLIEHPGSSFTVEMRCVSVEGVTVNVEAAVTNLLADADVGAVVVNCYDITERRQVEAQLIQAQKMEGIGRLAGGIAHDFNNILTAIIGYAGLARRELPEGSPGRDDIDGVLNAASRAGDLTRQLLAFARKQPARPQLVDPRSLIVNLESLLARMLGEDITLAVVVDARLGLIRIDPVQFEQLLVNLAVNARDAMPEGGELRIATSTASVRFDGVDVAAAGAEPNDYVCLTVSDTGTGISPDVRPHIFEPFFTTKDPARGTGLGLSTCYGIVEQAGGHIVVESALGSGSTFNVYFPSVAPVDAVPVAAGSGVFAS